MVRTGNRIILDCKEAALLLGQLLMLVEEENCIVQICRDGIIVAEMHRPGRTFEHLRQHQELIGVKIIGDITAPLDEEDWPEEYR